MYTKKSTQLPMENLKSIADAAKNSSKTEIDPIQCKNLWKIYGQAEKKALAAIKKESLDKTQVKERFGCIVGVADVTFSVKRDEIFCVMGLSGSGKSTLIRHINRLIEPTQGQVLINGADINKLKPAELRQLRAEKTGMVFQNMALFPHRTIQSNVAYGLEVRKVDKKERIQAARKALDLVQLSGWEEHYPDELSGGMQQRVGLARALASDPEILLMDEPFSALDPLIRRQLQDQFLSLSARLKKTTIFITHDLDEAIRLGNRIAIMKDGVFSQIGTPEDIVTKPADDYVADFVSGISRLHLVSAHTVMYPIDFYRSYRPDENIEHLTTIKPDIDLDQLAEKMIDNLEGRLAVEEDGKIIGVVTRRSLLNGIRGQDIDKLVPR